MMYGEAEDPRVKIASCGCLTDGAGFLIQAICQPHASALMKRASILKSLVPQAPLVGETNHCEICAPQEMRIERVRCLLHSTEAGYSPK